MAYIDKKALLQYLELIDAQLEGATKRVELYCAGGTALTLRGTKNVSDDIDLVIAREDRVTISTIAAGIERRHKIRIDLMWEGEVVGYFLPPDYRTRARKIPLSFRNVDLYVLSDVDLLLMKALSGRPKDYGDIKELIKTVGKEEIVKRFHELRFKKGKKGKLSRNLDEFIGEFDE